MTDQSVGINWLPSVCGVVRMTRAKCYDEMIVMMKSHMVAVNSRSKFLGKFFEGVWKSDLNSNYSPKFLILRLVLRNLTASLFLIMYELLGFARMNFLIIY